MKFFLLHAFLFLIVCNSFGQEVTEKNIFDFGEIPQDVSVDYYYDQLEKNLIVLEDKEKLYDDAFILAVFYSYALASEMEIDVKTRIIRLVNIMAEKDLYLILTGGFGAGTTASNINKKGNPFGIKVFSIYECTPLSLEHEIKEMYNDISKRKLTEKFGESWKRIFR